MGMIMVVVMIIVMIVVMIIIVRVMFMIVIVIMPLIVTLLLMTLLLIVTLLLMTLLLIVILLMTLLLIVILLLALLLIVTVIVIFSEAHYRKRQSTCYRADESEFANHLVSITTRGAHVGLHWREPPPFPFHNLRTTGFDPKPRVPIIGLGFPDSVPGAYVRRMAGD
ncbi:MAG: hypothetical protein WBQ20_17175, partial [Methyloceanibacter sp.]